MPLIAAVMAGAVATLAPGGSNARAGARRARRRRPPSAPS
jgi:hypothetical protein